MSTSNLKSPSTIRHGYVKSWEKENLGFEHSLSFLKWELSKLNITLISSQKVGTLLSLFYYRWIQVSFKSRASQKPMMLVKSEINSTEFFDKDLSNYRNKNKSIKSRKRLALIDLALSSQMNYQIPYITQVLLSLYLKNANWATVKEVSFINISKRVELAYKPLDLKTFVNQTPLIKGNIRAVYHILDMVVLTDLISLKISGSEILGKLVGKILERSSKKGLFVKSLRILSKLPLLIKKFEIREDSLKNMRSWNWGIKVTGKIGGMGRTKVYNVFSTKMPLHTINNDIDYSETIVNTKAGTFSIKVWILR